jgi:hypothetical protein
MTSFTTTISAKRITRSLFTAIAVLGIAHLIGLTINCLIPQTIAIHLCQFVNLDRERNLPALFSVGLLLLNAALFFVIHRNSQAFRERRRVWLLLGVTFTGLGIDQFSALHESIRVPVRPIFYADSGVLYDAWLIPYIIATLIIAAIVLPTIVKLRASIREWIILAIVLYGMGAIGMEIVSGLLHNFATGPNFFYGLLVGTKKLLEMSGLATLTYALLMLIEKQYGGLTLIIPNQNQITYNYASYTSDRVPPVHQVEFTTQLDRATQ